MSDQAPLSSSQLLTVEQVAERWQVKPAHVYRLARQNRLPTVELGRYKRWRLDAIEAFEIDGGITKVTYPSETQIDW